MISPAFSANLALLTAELAPFNFGATFFEGFLSFASPCVLPLVPGYLSFISGVTVAKAVNPNGNEKGELENHIQLGLNDTCRVIIATLVFIAGFTTVFIAIFGLAYTLSDLLGADLKPWIQTIAGLAVIVMGLHFTGLFKLKILNLEKRFQLSKLTRSTNLLGAFAVGAAFAAGWSPCVGPLLGTALTTAIDSQSTLVGVSLMLIYSAGLGIPFLLAGIFMSRLLGFLSRIRRHYQLIEFASGLLLLLVGLMIITNNMTELTRTLARFQAR